MLKKFSVLPDVDISALLRFNDELRAVLEALDAGLIFSKGYYSHASYKAFLQSFVDGQREFIGHIKSDSWSIVPDDEGMESDARVDFVFMPTYLVTAILSRTLCEYPLLALSIPNYSEALRKGMHFCTYRNLKGHGYDYLLGMTESLKILSLGKVPWLLERYPKFCPELYYVIRQAIREIKDRLSSGHTTDMWGGDLQQQFTEALVTLSIKNDTELFSVIKSTNPDSDLLNEEDINL